MFLKDTLVTLLTLVLYLNLPLMPSNNELTTLHLLEWLKFKRLTILNIAKDVEKSETSYITGGKVNGTATLENILTVVFEVKHILT